MRVGDMAGDLPDGPFALVFVANEHVLRPLLGGGAAGRVRHRAARLEDDGRFVLDAFVPDDPPRSTSIVEVQKVTVDGVVISVSDADIPSQTAWGQFVEMRADGIRLRPWKVRWSTPAELDEMAAAAGLVLVERHSSWDKEPFTEDSATTCRSTVARRRG